MNVKKIKKLVKNPRRFFSDSKALQRIKIKKGKKSINSSLGFIVIGDNEEFINATLKSIYLANAPLLPVNCPFKTINITEPESFSVQIHNAAAHLATEYVKILYQGELVHKDFLKEFQASGISEINSPIVINAYSHDISTCQLDSTIANIKAKSTSEKIQLKDYFLPVPASLIFKTDLLFNVEEYLGSCSFSDSIINILNITASTKIEKGIPYLNKAFIANADGNRLDARFQNITKEGENFIQLLNTIELLVKKTDNLITVKKSIFCLLHNVILILLKNKKSDELISEEHKEIIKEKIVNIVNLFGTEVIKNYSANNYNHVHKIGYFKLCNRNADKDLCYIEDVNENDRCVKLKISSHHSELPRIFVNDNEAIPLAAKIKDLTIFDLPFAWEVYLWLSYSSQSHEVTIQSKFKTEIMVSGKRQTKSSIGNIINSHLKKIAITEKLPPKVKALRFLSNLSFIRSRLNEAWLFIDNELRADDNAEHFYRYISKNQTHINSYFIISKKSSDWARLKKDGFKLIKFGGLIHRLALLNAKHLLSSHANPAIVNFLPRKHFCDIMDYKFTFLQHGITKDDQSEWLNSRKIDYLVTAAWHEFNDIAGRGRYRYTAQETLLSGFPRYDNLQQKIESKKQILIMPTWRKGLAGELMKKSSKRVKNPEFINSLFCKMWGGFLRSDELKELAKKYDYQIIFLPHPNLTDYLDELAIPDYIEIGSLSTGIQNIFKDSDLLITDYSSVAFDVAYMKKPIIYFQFDSDTFFSDHSYSKGYYDYNSLGFGPVVNEISALNNELKKSLKDNCELTPFYKNRIAQFFPFEDFNNSARLFKALSKCKNSHDTTTILNYLMLQISSIDITAVLKTLDRFEKELSKIGKPHAANIKPIIDKLTFLAILKNHNGLRQKTFNLASQYDLITPELSNVLYNSQEDENEAEVIKLNEFFENLYYITCNIVSHTKLSENNSSSYCLDNYARLLGTFISCYQKEQYGQAVQLYTQQLFTYQTLLPREVEIAYALSLIKTGYLDIATVRLKDVSLKEEEKVIILTELYKHHKAKHLQNLSIDYLIPNFYFYPEATVIYFKLCNDIPLNLYSKFNEIQDLPDEILTQYINQLFNYKRHEDLLSVLNEKNNLLKYINNDTSKANYFISIYINSGIEKFIDALLKITDHDNLVNSIKKIFLNNEHLDPEIIYQIIEDIVIKELYPFTCAEIYKYSLFFYKKNRRGLAKKIATLAVMKRHENFYSDQGNWHGEDDYKTLLTAVAELNDAIEELSRIA